MNKPLVLIKQEMEEELVKIINKYKLPGFILKPILKGLYEQSIQLEQQELETAKRNYKESEVVGKDNVQK